MTEGRPGRTTGGIEGLNPRPPRTPLALTAQALLFAAFMLVVGVLSSAPRYRWLGSGQAMVTVSFSHAGSPAGECRELSAAELEELAPNMRRPRECPRERVPLHLVLRIDGRTVVDRSLPPSGLWNDGAASIHQRFRVDAGNHEIEAMLRDTLRESGFDHSRRDSVRLEPGENLVIDFGADGFSFR